CAHSRGFATLGCGFGPFESCFPFRRFIRRGTSMAMSSKFTVGFLGAGKMATALAAGFVRAEIISAKQIVASDPIETARASFQKEVGARTLTSNAEVIKAAQVLILAVKPDQAASVLSEIRAGFTRKHLLISIVAG